MSTTLVTVLYRALIHYSCTFLRAMSKSLPGRPYTPFCIYRISLNSSCPLNCSRTGYLARVWAEWNKPHPWIVPAPLHLCDYLGRCGSTINHLITWVASQCAAKLVKVVIYNFLTVQCSCIRSICHNQVQISCSFGLNLLGVQCAYECGSVAILITVSTPYFFAPVLELYPHVSTPWHGIHKMNSRK